MSADLPAVEFVECCRYAQEVLRRWRLGPDWLERSEPADDEGLDPGERVRRLRQLGALRILHDEVRGEHDVETTGRALSALAADCLSIALAEADRETARRGESPDDAPRLGVLALGKLGGDELNFNSDIDLVYVCRAPADEDARSAQRERLTRAARTLARLLEAVTARGRAWVVDTRLRPFGQSGALVWSLEAMEQYFLNEGRAWERYAWLKARPVAGDTEAGAELLDRLEPFVYRRYLDYGLFDALRTLHQEIDRKSRREDLGDDIKRGPGGIRELEFLVQSLQLLRGGREPDLRTTGFLPALRAARSLRIIDETEAGEIDADYRFLRALENRLQAVTGRQTHELPGGEDRERLAVLMGRSGWSALKSDIDEVRARVRDRFHSRFAQPDDAPAPASRVWPPPENLESEFRDLGFDDPAAAAEQLERLDRRLARRPLSAEGRRRLDRLMPRLFDEVLEHVPPDPGLEDLLKLIETIARRSAYLALLHERPRTLERTVRVFRASDRVAAWIIASPQLLDDLLDPINGFDLPTPPAVRPDETEESMHALARFRQAGFVRTALGQLDGALDRAGARLQLTALAEQVLAGAARLAGAEDPSLVIVGYGNLGAGELHYTSDLDLVFLHDGEDAPLRPVQRLINLMQLPMAGGRLYEVDTRLRPNGNAGMLVSALGAFAGYQRDQAWTWEHQALIRARCLSGGESLESRFETVRREVLCRSRDEAETVEAVRDMRRRQREQRAETAEKSVLVDIQFLAELGVLVLAHRHPELVEHRSTVDLVPALARHGWFDDDEAEGLLDVHRDAAALRDRLFLERNCEAALDDRAVERVRTAWQRRFGSG